MIVLYKHIRKDTNQVFYIGIGNEKRAYITKGRNKHWYNVVNKHGYIVEIIQENLDWASACKEEIKLIKKYGRKDLGNGTLVNMTDGGDGILGIIRNKETCKKISESLMGHVHSNETRQKISNSNKGNSPTEETRKKLSDANIGLIRSKETKHKMSIAKQNITKITRHKLSIIMTGKIQRRVICPHCNIEGGINNMNRYHFDNCKYKI